MVYSPTMPNMKLTAQDMGAPDYQQALQNVFNNVYKPRTMQEQLLNAQLTNKINQPKADNAQEWYKAQLQALTSGSGLNVANTQKIMQAIQQDAWLNNILNPGARYNQTAETPDHNQPSNNNSYYVDQDGFPLPSGPNSDFPVHDDIPQNSSQASQGASPKQAYTSGVAEAVNQNKSPIASNEKVLNQGNPNLEYLNNIYDQYPGARKALESRGIKKTTVAKVDPRTGLTSIMTTYPNGKITVQASGQGPNGEMPLTNAVKTLNQNIISLAPRAIKAIDSIIAAPSPATLVPGWRKGSQKIHSSLVQSAAETYAKAKGWPNTGASIKMARDILERGAFELDNDYRDRLKSIQEALKGDIEDANNTLGQKSVSVNNKPKVIDYIFKNGRYVPK